MVPFSPSEDTLRQLNIGIVIPNAQTYLATVYGSRAKVKVLERMEKNQTSPPKWMSTSIQATTKRERDRDAIDLKLPCVKNGV